MYTFPPWSLSWFRPSSFLGLPPSRPSATYPQNNTHTSLTSLSIQKKNSLGRFLETPETKYGTCPPNAPPLDYYSPCTSALSGKSKTEAKMNQELQNLVTRLQLSANQFKPWALRRSSNCWSAPRGSQTASLGLTAIVHFFPLRRYFPLFSKRNPFSVQSNIHCHCQANPKWSILTDQPSSEPRRNDSLPELIARKPSSTVRLVKVRAGT